jgi:hypothetical protein
VPNGEKKVRPEQGLSSLVQLLSYEEAASRLGFRRESGAYDPEAHLLFSSDPGTGTVRKWFPLFSSLRIFFLISKHLRENRRRR